MKVSCLNPIAEEGLSLFSADYETGAAFSEAELALVRSASVHDMPLPQQMLAIARAGAGVNNIPLADCAAQGIVVFNTPGANANGVKELVIAGMLLASRDILAGCRWVESIKDQPEVGKQVEKGKKQFSGGEISGKTIGILGLGAIGIQVANCAAALGMNAVAYTRNMSEAKREKLLPQVRCAQSMDEVLSESDFLSLHMALTPETKGLINRSTIDKMKDGAVLLNFARDTLVNDADLKEALACGKLRRYVTDFPNDAVSGVPGVIAIPHLGASTKESEDNCAIMAVRQLRDYAENGNIVNSVNYPDCSLGEKSQSRAAILYRAGQFNPEAFINDRRAVSAIRGDWGYCLIEDSAAKDICSAAGQEPGVVKTRLL